MRGGHGRGGRLPYDAAQRQLHGTEERTQHRRPRDVGVLMVTCEAPADLSPLEREYWDYFAPQLQATRRLSLVAKHVLSNYCGVLATIARLRQELAADGLDVDTRRDLRRDLRQFILASRLLENDLLLNPASALRAPEAVHGLEREVDEFAEFDDPPPRSTLQRLMVEGRRLREPLERPAKRARRAQERRSAKGSGNFPDPTQRQPEDG